MGTDFIDFMAILNRGLFFARYFMVIVFGISVVVMALRNELKEK
jgi:hypothetical protein